MAAIAGRNGALLMKKALASRDEFHQVHSMDGEMIRCTRLPFEAVLDHHTVILAAIHTTN